MSLFETKEVSEVCTSESSRAIIKEMVLNEESLMSPNNLEKLFKPLMTIQPTSVESKGAFSDLGCFVIKLEIDLKMKHQILLCFYAVTLSSSNLGKTNTLNIIIEEGQ